MKKYVFRNKCPVISFSGIFFLSLFAKRSVPSGNPSEVVVICTGGTFRRPAYEATEEFTTAMLQFDALFMEYKRRFTLFADSYIHDMQLAEDIVTDAFMAYWEAFRQSPPAEINAPAYILTIVKNKCINELEHRKVHEKFVASSQTDAQWELRIQLASLRACDPEEIFTAEMEELVRRSLRKLPPKAQKVFTMSRLEGRSHREIAVELGLSVKSVEYYMNIALRTLRADLAGYVAALIFYLGR